MPLLLRRQDPVLPVLPVLPAPLLLLRTAPAAPGSVRGSGMPGGDVVAAWEVALSDGVHRVEFAHGTTTGKRVVYVNGTEVLRRDWMFKLVGKETFTLGGAGTRATVNIQAVSGFAYEYSLNVDGKSLQTFTDRRAKTTQTWLVRLDGAACRVVLEKDTMDVWCNGQKMETTVRNLTPEPRGSSWTTAQRPASGWASTTSASRPGAAAGRGAASSTCCCWTGTRSTPPLRPAASRGGAHVTLLPEASAVTTGSRSMRWT